MKDSKGYLLIDAMLSLSIIFIITLSLIPMLHTMNTTYRNTLKQVEHYRDFYIYVKSGGAVENREERLCKKESDECIETK